MNTHNLAGKIIHFPLTKIIIGLLIVGTAITIGQIGSSALLKYLGLPIEIDNLITGIISASLCLISYIFLFKFYEKRKISELSLNNFGKNSGLGLAIGFILQSLVILVIFLSGGYSVTKVNSIISLLPAFTISLTSGITEEILVRGIIFRLTEEKLGTVIALIISALFFGFAHIANDGATIYSSIAIAVEAGILLAAVYVYTRNLWISIFLHFAWNFTEGGVYGAIVSGFNLKDSLLTANFSGPEFLTGGNFGPENSVQAFILCTIAGVYFLVKAKQKGNFIEPFWKNKEEEKPNFN
ncbi:MAG: CPBP family intramembrane metalloprotease [Ignavibacteriales bacterium]|nr:CPBP family intramembrane metalloprotease [Ignavibacteriales bacterium]MBK7980318.1 CPBP family intramembrane metalloprotease [Ignavibacteriota bacterium]